MKSAKVAIVLLSVCSQGVGCRPQASTRPLVQGEQAEQSGPSRRGFTPDDIDPSAAYAGHDDVQLEGDKARKRPAPAPVSDRDAAMKAAVTGNPEGARDFLKQHLADRPDDLQARQSLARAHWQLGAYEQALRVLEDPKGAPQDELVLQMRARLLAARGRHGDAIGLLERVLKDRPDSIPLRGELLQLLVETGAGDDPAAQRLMDGMYDSYDAGEVESAAQLLAVAQAALARGSKGAFHDANMVLEDAEAKEPVGGGAWVADRVLLTRGHMFLEKYAKEDADTTFDLLLERDPWHPDALAGKAWVHVDALQFAMGSRLAQEALQVNPEHPDAHAVLARIALIEGRRDEARERIADHVFGVDDRHTSGLAVMAALALMETSDGDYRKWRDQALQRNPKNGRFYRELADILGFLHLYPEADEILREGTKLDPKDPYLHAARGLNLLRLGDEKTARTELDLAWKRDPFNARTRNVLDLYEQSIDPHYGLVSIGDLTIRLPTEDKEFVQPVIVESVEWSRRELDEAYGTKVEDLRLEFFRQPEEFSVRTVGVPSLGAVAVCFGRVITFIGPYHGHHNLENVIRHEMGHVYAIAKSRGRVPRWFTEGLSEWESELADPAWARESSELLQQARRMGKLRRLHELELAFIRAESPAMMEVAYSTAAYAVRYLGQTYGRDKLVRMLEGYGQGKTTDVLFEEILGKDMPSIEKDFEQWFFAELDSKISGWHPSPDPGAGDELDALFRRALEQVGRGDKEAAVRTLQELLNRGGDGYASRMVLGKIAAEGSTPGAAAKHFEAAAKHHVEAIEPLVRLAELARTQDQPSDEKRHLAAAIALDGDSFEPAARLLMLAELTGDVALAAKALRRARGTAPLHPLSLAGVALQHERSGDQARAKASVKRGIAALESAGGGGPADTMVMLALAAEAVGDRELAAKMAKAAIEAGNLPSIARKKLATL